MSADFFDAIKQGDQKRVEQMLNDNGDLIHATSESKTSPILTAVYYRQKEIARFLAERAIMLDIFEAAATGSMVQTIRLLARNPEKVNTYSPDGFQPLGLACYFGHIEVAEYLIKAGAEINSTTRNALMAAPLHLAAAGDHLKLVRLLIERGANPNPRQADGFTPLHHAAQNGNTAILRLLIFHGADLKAKAGDGRTAVDLADEGSHHEAADLLRKEITRRFRNPFSR